MLNNLQEKVNIMGEDMGHQKLKQENSKNQVKTVELKDTLFEIKNFSDGLKTRLNTAE